MKKEKLFFVIPTIVILGLTLWSVPRLPETGHRLIEWQLNHSLQEYFANSIHIEKIAWDHHLRIRFTGITGKLKTRQSPVSLEIRSLASQDPFPFFIVQKPVRFIFDGLRPQGSLHPGISGTFASQWSVAPRFDFVADLGNTDLEDWQWLDPSNLGGATGAMKGRLALRQAPGREPVFRMNLEAPHPGGNIQARFFDLFLPYLPSSIQKEKVLKVSQSQKLIRYQTASLEVDLPQNSRLKIFLRIFIPDYNLKLTLNAAIQTDAENAFSQVARIMGLIA